MRASVPRATFIALRARREALHIASDVLYEAPIDVRTVACSGCGAWIDVRGKTITDPLTCPTCFAKTPLPAYLRGKYMARRPPTPIPLNYIASDAGVAFVDPQPSLDLPRWLVWFTVILFTMAFGAVAAYLTW
ncbi:MAG: hypothetical protein M3478_06260 [Planctomycetota bacterium]|nr:hypothetical protein [Planctomycetota bacterium]